MKDDKRQAVRVAVHTRPWDQHGLLPHDSLPVVPLKRVANGRHEIKEDARRAHRQQRQERPQQRKTDPVPDPECQA
jgi:hypothetical protein